MEGRSADSALNQEPKEAGKERHAHTTHTYGHRKMEYESTGDRGRKTL